MAGSFSFLTISLPVQIPIICSFSPDFQTTFPYVTYNDCVQDNKVKCFSFGIFCHPISVSHGSRKKIPICNDCILHFSVEYVQYDAKYSMKTGQKE